MQTRQLMEIIYVLCTLYCTTIFGHSIEAVTKAEILPAVQKSVCLCTHPRAKVLTPIEVII